jgi:hypothetical protein
VPCLEVWSITWRAAHRSARIDANGNDRYDLKALGESSFARSLGMPNVPEEATNPAACGVVTGAAAPMPPHGGVETGGGVSDAISPWSAFGAASLAAVFAAWAWRRAQDSPASR